MFKKRHYVALGSVALVALLVLHLPARASSRLRTAVGSLFLPFFGLASSAQQLPGKTIDALTPRGQLLKEINDLREENQQLKIRQQQFDTALAENNQLRAQLGWAQQQPWKMKLAHVVLRDPANWWNTIQIDVGTRDG